MSPRNGVLLTVVLFYAGFVLLTLIDLARNGVTPLAVVAIVVLVFIGIGVFGAFAQPPRR
jgi:hypothetical protein